MPLLEFQCETCERTFEELVQNPLRVNGVKCAECGSGRVVRLFSAFASRSGTGTKEGPATRTESPWSGGGGCGCGSACGCR